MPHMISNIGDFVVISPTVPYKDVLSVNGFAEDIVWEHSGELGKEFRWSLDSESYSAWVELVTQEVQKIMPNNARQVYAQFRYTLKSGGPVTITTVGLVLTTSHTNKYTGFEPIRVDQSGGNAGPVFLNNSTFNPYAVDSAIRMYNQLSSVVNNMFGHLVDYYLVVPDGRGKDIVLQEYTLYGVSTAKCIKLLVPNNEFPDSKINFNLFGMDFEIPFEVHIVKEYWESVFGFGTGPQRFDIIYFPLMNRLYEVSSSYLNREFMGVPTYYKISLVRYTPKVNTKIDSPFRQQLDSLTTNQQKIFGSDLDAEYKKVSNSMQNLMATTTHDPVRKTINSKLVISNTNIDNYFTVISTSNYQMNSIFSLDGSPSIAVEYHSRVNITSISDIAFTCWFREKSLVSPTRAVVSVTEDNGVVIAVLQGRLNGLVIGEYVTIVSVSMMNNRPIVGQVTDIDSSETIITIECHPDVTSDISTRIPGWTSRNDLKLSRTSPRPFLVGHTGSDGIRIDVLASWVIRIIRNTEEYVFLIPESLIPDKWYGVVMNISNSLQQLNVNLYSRIWESSASNHNSTSLDLVYRGTKTGIAAIEMVTSEPYRLESGPLDITNIRVMSKIIEPEIQDIFLNRNRVQDAQLALIIDNAGPQLNIPYAGNPK